MESREHVEATVTELELRKEKKSGYYRFWRHLFLSDTLIISWSEPSLRPGLGCVSHQVFCPWRGRSSIGYQAASRIRWHNSSCHTPRDCVSGLVCLGQPQVCVHHAMQCYPCTTQGRGPSSSPCSWRLLDQSKDCFLASVLAIPSNRKWFTPLRKMITFT